MKHAFTCHDLKKRLLRGYLSFLVPLDVLVLCSTRPLYRGAAASGFGDR